MLVVQHPDSPTGSTQPPRPFVPLIAEVNTQRRPTTGDRHAETWQPSSTDWE